MTEMEIRANAMIAELTMQRDQGLNRCADLAAKLAEALARVKALEAERSAH